MTIEIATEQSVLVELTAEDLQSLHLTYEQIGSAQSKTVKAWKTILQEIRQRTGRVYSDREVEIDMLPSRSGGCLMIVSLPHAMKTEFVDLCVLEDCDALTDYLSAARRFKALHRCKLYRLQNGCYAVQTDERENTNLLMREFGTYLRLTNQQFAAVSEQAECLKVFCGL